MPDIASPIRLCVLTLLLLAAVGTPPVAGAQDTATAPAQPAGTASTTLPSKQYRIEDFIETVGVTGASFSADESRILFSSNKSGIWNAYSMPVAGGDWTAVTKSTTDNNYAVAYFPDDDRVLVTRDQGGNELNHLYVIEADGKEKDLTPGDKLKANFAGFSHDGRHFYVTSNERDAKFFDLYRYDSKTYARERLYQNDAGYELGPISDDGRWLALGKVNTTNDSDLFVADLRDGKVTKVSRAHRRRQLRRAGLRARLAVAVLHRQRWRRIRRAAPRRPRQLEARSRCRKPTGTSRTAYFSHNGKYRVVAINEDGRTVIQLIDVASGTAGRAAEAAGRRDPRRHHRALARSAWRSTSTATASRTISTCSSSAASRRN